MLSQCACVRACVCACVRVCVCLRARDCVYVLVSVCVGAWNDVHNEDSINII